MTFETGFTGRSQTAFPSILSNHPQAFKGNFSNVQLPRLFRVD